ncbi:flagellar operon protein (TIGR03826 family) [Anaerosolibacter carboniphilus]|uniref:Flagellar operon protein (TIGR03826 family) n=1 Tax=Anaerosolibacter carboniphilus TaxID=1417629 RepID=A0A841KVZ2_9FIRM|nr:TIGR03826 family flagellar region protein [Anaerosolibacter carboniphilus]MBB6216408.1 flagellar operon protein (TIGR03826 family) [Anaerosolibacter carboniphilus]
MGDIRNCKQCGKLFQYNGITKICAKCAREDDELFKVVKEYVYDHPGATITEVSEETNVDEDRILRYLRQGKLELTGEGGALVLDCERCGRGIKTGRFCDACAHEIETELKSGFSRAAEKQKPIGNKMFTAEMNKRR